MKKNVFIFCAALLLLSWDLIYGQITHSYEGDMKSFVYAVSQDGSQKIITAASLNYDWKSDTGDPLSSVGVVEFDDKGIVAGSNAKSGYVNINTLGKYRDSTGKVWDLELKGVSFWVNKGGANWWDFNVSKIHPVSSPDNLLSFSIQIEKIKDTYNRPVIIIEGSNKLYPQIFDLSSIIFTEEVYVPPVIKQISLIPENIEVFEIQQRLIRLGYNVGTPDGKWGQMTKTAYTNFQQKNNLPLTDKIESKTIEVLREKTCIPKINYISSNKDTITTGNIQRVITKHLVDKLIYDSVYENSITISPDGKNIAYIVLDDGKEFVILNGIKGSPYEKIWNEYEMYEASSKPVFSKNNLHFAYITQKNGKKNVVYDGFESRSYDDIIGTTVDRYFQGMSINSGYESRLQFSPDSKRLIYAVNDFGKEYIIDNNKSLESYSSVTVPRISPDGKRFAYIAVDSDTIFWLIIDERKKSITYEIQSLQFSPDSKHFVFVNFNFMSNKGYIEYDNQERGEITGDFYGETELMFSPDSKKFAYITRDSSTTYVVLNNKNLKSYQDISALQFSPKSSHIFYAAIENEQYFVINDSIEGKRYDEVLMPVYSPDDSKLVYPAKKDGLWYIVTNGIEKEYGYPIISRVYFSPNSIRTAFWIEKQNKYALMVDDLLQKPVDAYSEPFFSKDNKYVIYPVIINDKKTVMINGHEGLFFDGNIASLGIDSYTQPDLLHYYAIDKKCIYFVEEKITQLN